MKLILSNFLQRPTRTFVSIMAVALGVVLVLVSVGLCYGQLTDTAERTRRIGGDFLFQPSDASLLFALNSGTLPVRIKEVLEKVEGVEAATPILAKFLADRFHLVFGIDHESFEEVNSSLRFVDGALFTQPFEAVVDTVYSTSNQVRVGDEIEILGHRFKVRGVFVQGTASRVMVPLATLQEINGTPEKATMFFIKGRQGVPEEQVYKRLRDRFKHYKITRTADLQEIMASSTPVFRQFVAAVVFLSVVISFLVILLAMYSTITERTREIGILKSLGASRSYIVQLILKESVLICAAGVTVGFILNYLALQLILANFPTMPVSITLFWKVAAAVLGIGGGVMGALYPALKAAGQDPVKALGYE